MGIDNPEMGADSMAMSFGGKPKLLFLFQWFAVLMSLASAVAALPVAALSFECYGAAMFFGRVRPLRHATNFSPVRTTGSSNRLGEEVLRDPETPAPYD